MSAGGEDAIQWRCADGFAVCGEEAMAAFVRVPFDVGQVERLVQLVEVRLLRIQVSALYMRNMFILAKQQLSIQKLFSDWAAGSSEH